MLEKIYGDIYLVRGKNNGRFPFSHSILIRDKLTVLVDAGCGYKILEGIKREFTPDMVLLSHGHPDHCSGASCFSPDVLWCPEQSRQVTGKIEMMARRFAEPGLRTDWISYIKEGAEFKDFEVGNSFGSNSVFRLGNTVLETVYAPGHTEDHYCFYFPEEKIMLAVDIDFTSFGPWYGHPESDIDRFMHSIEQVKSYDMETAVSSHLGVIRDGIHDKFNDFLASFENREKAVLDFLSVPRSIDDFVERAIIYKKYSYRESLLRCWESNMIRKHLSRLIKGGLVKHENGKFTRIS